MDGLVETAQWSGAGYPAPLPPKRSKDTGVSPAPHPEPGHSKRLLGPGSPPRKDRGPVGSRLDERLSAPQCPNRPTAPKWKKPGFHFGGAAGHEGFTLSPTRGLGVWWGALRWGALRGVAPAQRAAGWSSPAGRESPLRGRLTWAAVR